MVGDSEGAGQNGEADAASSDSIVPGETDGEQRRHSRRRALIGFGAVAAGVGGWAVVGRSSNDVVSPDEVADAAGSGTPPRNTTSTTVTTDTTASGSSLSEIGPGEGLEGEAGEAVLPDLSDLARWSDPATWGGSLPIDGAAVTLPTSILLDQSVNVGSLSVPEGTALIFDPVQSLVLESTGNVIVEGLLSMEPASADLEQRIRFLGVDEARMVGGGMAALATDVGLWVMGGGTVQLVGATKEPWGRPNAPLTSGTSTVKLDRPAAGWRAGDQLVFTPTGSPSSGNVTNGYDRAEVVSVSGATVTFSPPLSHDHPFVTMHRGAVHAPEILNLSRNVGVEGTAGGRSHVLIHSPAKQVIAYAEMQHTGPRRPETFVLGRYGLHFHHCGDGVRGTRVTGVVIHSSGNHGFVAHKSNGITFDSCITHDTLEDAFWWDDARITGGDGTDSYDIRFLSCVASLTQTGDIDAGRRLGGFSLGKGGGNECKNCVAVGVTGGGDSSGFKWPEKGSGPWVFEDCVGHNNSSHGIFVWQNDAFIRPVERFTGYHNGAAGVMHGAYTNNFRYIDCDLHGNGESAAVLHALGKADGLQWSNVVFDGAGVSPHALVLPSHQLPSAIPVTFSSSLFRASTGALVATSDSGRDRPLETAPDSIDFFDCEFDGDHLFLFSNLLHPDSLVRLQSGGSVTELRRADQAGVLDTQWNARVSTFEGAIPEAVPNDVGKGGDSAPAAPADESDPEPRDSPDKKGK